MEISRISSEHAEDLIDTRDLELIKVLVLAGLCHLSSEGFQWTNEAADSEKKIMKSLNLLM